MHKVTVSVPVAKERANLEYLKTQANDLYWREIFENATEPMLVIDQAGRVYEANQAALGTVGYSMEEVLSPWFNLFEKIIHPNDKEQLVSGFAYLVEINEPLRFRLNIYAKDGKKIPTVSSFRKLSRMEGWNTDRFVITSTNISEFKALEKELRSTLDILGSVLHKVGIGDLESVIPLDQLPDRYKPVGEMINVLLQETKHSKLEMLGTLQTQANTIKELATPVIPVWSGVLAAPLLGSFDSVRMNDLSERLLEEVAAKKPRAVLLDLSGLAFVDTQVVSEVIHLVTAVKLLGSRTIISGIGPAVAQSLVRLGANLDGIPTYATLEQGLRSVVGVAGHAER